MSPEEKNEIFRQIAIDGKLDPTMK